MPSTRNQWSLEARLAASTSSYTSAGICVSSHDAAKLVKSVADSHVVDTADAEPHDVDAAVAGRFFLEPLTPGTSSFLRVKNCETSSFPVTYSCAIVVMTLMASSSCRSPGSELIAIMQRWTRFVLGGGSLMYKEIKGVRSALRATVTRSCVDGWTSLYRAFELQCWRDGLLRNSDTVMSAMIAA